MSEQTGSDGSNSGNGGEVVDLSITPFPDGVHNVLPTPLIAVEDDSNDLNDPDHDGWVVPVLSDHLPKGWQHRRFQVAGFVPHENAKPVHGVVQRVPVRVVRHAPPIPTNTAQCLDPEQVDSFWDCHAYAGEIVVVAKSSDLCSIAIDRETFIKMCLSKYIRNI